MTVPLARRLLFQNKVRLAASVLGVALAVVLVLVNLGLLHGVQTYATVLVRSQAADAWIVARDTPFFEFGRVIDRAVLGRVRSITGVERAEPLVLGPRGFSCRGGEGGPMNFIGVAPTNPGLPPPLVEGSIARLNEFHTAVVDRSIRRRCPRLALGDSFEVPTAQGTTRVRVVGFTEGLRPVTFVPYAFVSLTTERDLFPEHLDLLTFVAVWFDPAADGELVLRALERAAYPLEAISTRSFIRRHDEFWKRTADVRIILLVTSALGLIVGLLVVGQTVTASTLEHIKQFGTLKAIGASNLFVVRVVLNQALLAGGLGLVFGALLSAVFVAIVNLFLPCETTGGHILFAGVTIAATCVIAALASIVRVVRLAPTEVFR